VQENLLTKCPDLEIPTKETVGDLGKLVKTHEGLMYSYNDCAMTHDGLVDAVRSIQQSQKQKSESK
jgi:hypothetical protein